MPYTFVVPTQHDVLKQQFSPQHLRLRDICAPASLKAPASIRPVPAAVAPANCAVPPAAAAAAVAPSAAAPCAALGCGCGSGERSRALSSLAFRYSTTYLQEAAILLLKVLIMSYRRQELRWIAGVGHHTAAYFAGSCSVPAEKVSARKSLVTKRSCGDHSDLHTEQFPPEANSKLAHQCHDARGKLTLA